MNPEMRSSGEGAGAGEVGGGCHFDNNPIPPENQASAKLTDVLDTLKFLHPGNEVFELCIIAPTQDSSPHWQGKAFGKKKIVGGWFKDQEKAARLATQIEAEGVYVTLNPCQDALLARADHRLKANVDRTADAHIARIQNLLVDLDPIRPAGVSSTDQEHEAALEMIQIIRADLDSQGWSEPIEGDSGNGGHLAYPLDLPNTQESINLVKATLEALALRYADELKRRNLEIDLKVHNPARLTKLYDTMVRKGDNTQDRPHRLARLLFLPEIRQPVPIVLLQTLAATVQAQGTQAKAKEIGIQGRFDVKAYLDHYRVEVVKVKLHGSSTLFCLDRCLFDPSHNGNEAVIGQTAEGKLFYQCFHKSCKDRTWPEARQIISGGDSLLQFSGLPDRRAQAPRAIIGSDAEKEVIAWPLLAPEALYGLAGEFVRLVEPHTESDPTALLLQFLIGFGNLIGKGAYATVEADIHCCNLFGVGVGKTSKGRKGTSLGQVKVPLITIDPAWKSRVKSGLSSGEGLIFHVRDPIMKREARKKDGQTIYEDVLADPGVDDKRLLAVESEFANVLRQIERQGNILSSVMRDAWDTGDLETLTKNSPTKATGAHISIIGHITRDELKRYLTRTEAGNGFGNRILWFCVKRSKVLPEAGRLSEVNFTPFLTRLKNVVLFAQCAGEIIRSPEARTLWAKVYPDLSEGKPGLVGALTSRAEAQVLRLSMLYALLNGEKFVNVPHLLAALAVWDYCESSVKYIFGKTIGDPVADTILAALRAAPDGMTRTEIYNLLGRHEKSENIQQAIGELLRRDFVIIETIETGGRPTEKLRYKRAQKV